MKKILITGGAGFIGSNAAEYFCLKNWRVYIFDNLSRKGTKINLKRINKKISKFYLGDIKNFKKLNSTLKIVKPDVILHAAGQVAVTKSIENPKQDFQDNLVGTFNLLESVRLNKLKAKLIYTSTNKVYGNLNGLKLEKKKLRYEFKEIKKGINEKNNLDLHSPYGCSKGAADQYVNDYSRIYNINSFVLRQSCIYGKYQFGVEDQGWVAWFIIAFTMKKKLKIYGDGKQVRDILFIDDLCELFYKISVSKKNIKGGIFNVGGGARFSLSLLELIDELKKNNLITKFSFNNWRKGDQKIYISDNTKIFNQLRWKPKVNPKKGIGILIEWVKKNQDLISRIFNK
jgi:CDP-paratose 2-epimerase